MELKIKTNQIIISVWLNGDNGNIILAPGLPQYIDKYHPLVKQAERLGLNLFIPKYSGTYESGGKFTLKNSIKTLEKVIKLVKNGRAKELYANQEIKWKTSNINLIGFSFGALPCVLQRIKIKKTILVCPFIFLEFHTEGKGLGENISKTFNFLERAYTNLYRINSKNLLKELSHINVPYKKEQLILIFGKDDSAIPKEEQAKAKKHFPNSKVFFKEGGHSVMMDDSFVSTICGLKIIK